MEPNRQVKIFVGCLPSETIESQLYEYLTAFCEVSGLKIKYRSNSVCAGYGHFVCDNPSEDALSLLFSSPHYYQERSIEIR